MGIFSDPKHTPPSIFILELPPPPPPPGVCVANVFIYQTEFRVRPFVT